MSNLPPVSALCLTYGRPHLLEEAIHSFLLQDYAGEKELIILNDFPDQTLVFDHPEVKIINVSKRFATLGEKRNASTALASHDVLFLWDDDDICLPHRISLSIQRMKSEHGFFKQGPDVMVFSDGRVEKIFTSMFHGTCCYTRALFHQMRGYPAMGAGEDAHFEFAIQRHLGEHFPSPVALHEHFYLYRWAGTESYHASWYDIDKNEPSGAVRIAEFVREQVQRAEIPTGVIPLNPRWRANYPQLMQDFIRTLQQPLNAPTPPLAAAPAP